MFEQVKTVTLLKSKPIYVIHENIKKEKKFTRKLDVRDYDIIHHHFNHYLSSKKDK